MKKELDEKVLTLDMINGFSRTSNVSFFERYPNHCIRTDACEELLNELNQIVSQYYFINDNHNMKLTLKNGGRK